MAGEGGGAAGVTDGPLGATRGDATSLWRARLRVVLALRSAPAAQGARAVLLGRRMALAATRQARSAAAIATSRDSSSLTRKSGLGYRLEAVRARPPAGVPPVPAAPRFGRPRRRPAEAHQPPDSAAQSAHERGPRSTRGLCPIATTTGRRGLARRCAVAHLAEGVLRRVRSDHLDTADQIAVRAAELGSLRRDGAARRPRASARSVDGERLRIIRSAPSCPDLRSSQFGRKENCPDTVHIK